MVESAATVTIGHVPAAGLDCPRCSGTLETWVRAHLSVEFCDSCSALFLDRGELFQLFRSEGYDCPPETELRLSFSPLEAQALRCPKCRKATLAAGTVEGVEVWHCTPCNGFLVDRRLMLGEGRGEDVPLDFQGFERRTAAGGSYWGRLLARLLGGKGGH